MSESRSVGDAAVLDSPAVLQPARTNPFPGPKPYDESQRSTFFGREEAVGELIALTLASPIVVLHAPSGYGKSSLLSAGLLPRLVESPYRATVLPTIKFATLGREGDAAARESPRETADLRAVVTRARAARSQGLLILVLDQFERIFFDAASWERCIALFKDLAQSVRDDPFLRVVIGLRSDHLATFLRYEDYLDRGTVSKFALEALTKDETKAVICDNFAASGVPLPEGLLTRLVRALFEIELPGGRKAEAQFVNLLLLQITCRRQWQILADADTSSSAGGSGERRDSIDRIRGKELDRHLRSVEDALVEFVDGAINDVAAGTGQSQRILRVWLDGLTSRGQRTAVVLERNSDSGLPRDVIAALDESRLIQLEARSESVTLAELPHDSMVQALGVSNDRWVRRRRRSRLWKKLASGAALAIVVLSMALLRRPGDKELLVNLGPQTADAPVLATFTASRAAPIALVALAVDDLNPYLSPSGQTLALVRMRGNSPGKAVASSPTKFGSRTAQSATLIAPTTAGVRYGVVIRPLPQPIPITRLTVRGVPEISTSHPVTSRSLQWSFEAPRNGGAIRVRPGAVLAMEAEFEPPDVSGGRVDYVGDRSTVVETGRSRYLYLSATGITQIVSVRDVTKPGVLTPGGPPHRFHASGISTLLADVRASDVPVSIDAQCGLATIAFRNGNAAVGDVLHGAGGSVEAWVPSPSRVSVIIEPASDHTCQITVKSHHAAATTRVGTSDVQLAKGSLGSSELLRLNAESLLSAKTTDPDVTLKLTCPGLQTITSQGSRLVGYVPRLSPCVFLAERGLGSLRAETIQVDTVALPPRRLTPVRK